MRAIDPVRHVTRRSFLEFGSAAFASVGLIGNAYAAESLPRSNSALDSSKPSSEPLWSASPRTTAEGPGSLKFDPSGFGDAPCVFTLAHYKTRELRLRHAHRIGPVFCKSVAYIRRCQRACDVLR